MGDPGWRIARLREIPGRSESPDFSPDEYWKAMAERAPRILKRWADAGARFSDDNRRTHDVPGFLGVESFGANAYEAHEGELLVVPHDELGEGEQQEELYLVVEGRARFVCDGEAVELRPGEALYARPGVRREAIALEPMRRSYGEKGGTPDCAARCPSGGKGPPGAASRLRAWCTEPQGAGRPAVTGLLRVSNSKLKVLRRKT